MDVFCTKYFHEEEIVTLATLQTIKQRNGENLMEYIKRFRDIALDCYDHYKERTLVEMCKYDRGVQSRLGKLRNLLVCTVAAKGQEDCPICKTKP